MKKNVFITVSAAFLLVGCTSGPAQSSKPAEQPTPTPIPTASSEQSMDVEVVRSALQDSGKNAGIIYLGYADQDEDPMSLVGNLSYLANSRMCDIGAGDVYAFIAADPNAEVSISRWGLDEDGEEEEGEELLEVRDGGPVLIKGVVSETIPNVCIGVEVNDNEVIDEYTPMRSGKDGTVVLGDPIYKIMDLESLH